MHDFSSSGRVAEEQKGLSAFYFELKPKSQAIEPLPRSTLKEIDNIKEANDGETHPLI